MRSLPALLALALLAACGAEEPVAPAASTDTGTNAGADTTPATDTGTTPTADTGGTAADTTPGTIPGSCGYPMPTGFDIGQTIPDLVWETAYQGDGTQFVFDLEEVFCDAEWEQYTSLHFIVTTGWCPNCPNYIQYVDGIADQIEAAGGLVIYVTTEDAGGNPGTDLYAYEHTGEYTTNNTGIRVGDGDATPPMQIASSPIIQFVPTSFVVRTSDMTVVADQRLSEYNLPFVEIAGDPELDWSNPGEPTVRPDVETSCGADDEEVYEPNNRVSDAKTIGVGTFTGGICDSSPDFYYVDIDGPWSIYLGFDNEAGDLDMYIWDVDEQDLFVDELGEEVGSYSTDDDEYFEFNGPGYLYIVGYNQATAPYTLSINAL